jgi:glycosyltransferase involved in cell wall biosynthesis
MMHRLPELSASFPAHNEEANVEGMLQDMLDGLPEFAEVFEIIVVDDGSTDATYARAQAVADRDSRIRVLRHEVNRGYGAAVWTGLQAGTMDFAFFTDGDRQFEIQSLQGLVEEIADHDVVVGYRVGRQDNALRRANAHAWNLLIRALLDVPVRDIDCAFKLFRREALQGLQVEATGAMFSAELLARMVSRGARLMECPVGHLPRQAGVSSGGNVRVILRAFQELFGLYRELRRERLEGPAST